MWQLRQRPRESKTISILPTIAENPKSPDTHSPPQDRLKLWRLLTERIIRFGGRLALVSPNFEAWEYQNLYHQAETLVYGPKILGVSARQRAVVTLPIGFDCVRCLWAIANLGAVFVPLDPEMRDMVPRIFDSIRADALITLDDHLVECLERMAGSQPEKDSLEGQFDSDFFLPAWPPCGWQGLPGISPLIERGPGASATALNVAPEYLSDSGKASMSNV
jgi:hypothetical protein